MKKKRILWAWVAYGLIMRETEDSLIRWAYSRKDLTICNGPLSCSKAVPKDRDDAIIFSWVED